MGPCSFISTGAVTFETFKAVDSAFLTDQFKIQFALWEKGEFLLTLILLMLRIG
jgi:hypothetical protein